MSLTDAQQGLAAQRSHEDAKAANTLIQAAGQTAVLINGGAATATLTFSATSSAPVHIGLPALGSSLICFAFGVAAGAAAIGLQAASVQRWTIYWGSKVQDYDPAEQKSAEKLGRRYGVGTAYTLAVSIALFVVGVVVLGIALMFAKSASTAPSSLYLWSKVPSPTSSPSP